MLAVDRPVVFPLFAIIGDRCACGFEGCSRVGKHPACAWGELAYGDQVSKPAPGAGAGLKTGAAPKGSGVFVVDLDSDAAAELFDAMGPCPETFTVKTPRGRHLYFKHPGFHVKNSASDLGKGIDVRGDGGFVVAPGSPHRSGGTYAIENTAHVADAPAWLLTWLQARPAPTTAQHYPGDLEPGSAEHAYHRRLYADYLKSEAPARGPERRGQGDQILFSIVQRGAYDLALPVADVLELVAEHYDPRCDPQWGDELEERVHHKARDAKENSTRPRATPLPEDLAHLATSTPAPAEFGVQLVAVTPDASHWSSRIKRGADWNVPYVRPTYLLEGLIPRHTVCTFFAEGGSLKSWAAFALGICVATGTPWLGRYAVPKGKALILDYEDGFNEFRRRREILQSRAPHLDISDLEYVYAGPNIADGELWSFLARQGYALVIVDALNSGMPGGSDENDQSFSDGLKLAGRFAEGAQCNVVVVHHANKQGGMRGASAIRDQNDVVFRFEPVSETDNIKRMRMICDKPGPQKRPQPVNVELSDDGLRTFEEAATPTTAKAAGGPADTLAAARLAIETRGSISGAVELAALLGCGEKPARAALRALEERGEVIRGRDRRMWWADDASQRRRVLAAVKQHGEKIHSVTDLAKRSAAARATVEDMIAEHAVTRSSASDQGHFFLTG